MQSSSIFYATKSFIVKFLDLILKEEFNSTPSQVGQKLLGQLNFDVENGELSISLDCQYRIASILIRQAIRYSDPQKKQSLFTRTQETLGLNKEKMR